MKKNIHICLVLFIIYFQCKTIHRKHKKTNLYVENIDDSLAAYLNKEA